MSSSSATAKVRARAIILWDVDKYFFIPKNHFSRKISKKKNTENAQVNAT